ncbi:MAG: hypothetical protein ACK40G_13785 [Cytophagaceae bacterium]
MYEQYIVEMENSGLAKECTDSLQEAELWFDVFTTGLRVSNDQETNVFFKKLVPGTGNYQTIKARYEIK